MKNKRLFFLQWDSTNNCNLNCSHCYHKTHKKGEELPLSEVRNFLVDLKETTARWDFRPGFHISGGEPLFREDLIEILGIANGLNIETRILTNGTLLNYKKAKEIRNEGVERIQISIDGKRETHNKIRGARYAYDNAISGIRNADKAGIIVTVSATLIQSNKDELEDIIKNSADAGAKLVGFQTYIPNGKDDPELLGCREMYEAYTKIHSLNGKYPIHILENDVLWQLFNLPKEAKKYAQNQKKYEGGCSAGFTGLSVLADGSVYPCRRLPLEIGHIKEGIKSLVLDKKIMQELRDFNNFNCEDKYYCRGCRALAYATTGDYLAKDPSCFKAIKCKEEKNGKN